MTRYVPKPFSHPEESITGLSVIANPNNPRVRIESERLETGSTIYSVTSPIPLGRAAIAQLLCFPLGEAPDWKHAMRGLRDISYPSRSIAKLHQSPTSRRRLGALRPASKELALILERNQDYEERAVKIPVFSDGQAIEYTEAQLSKKNPVDVMKLLTRVDESSDTYRRLELLSATSPDETMLPIIDEETQYEIQNRAMLDEVSGLARVDAVHGLLDEIFTGLREEPTLDGVRILGGGFDSSVLVRTEDIPEYLRGRNTNNVRVMLGSELRDADRKTGLARRRVTFLSRRDGAFVAQPRISWTKDADGVTRRFIFPTSQNERSLLHPIIARSSSLLGAALVANRFGSAYDIDYNDELERLTRQQSKYAAPLARAGLLALVLHAKQERILGDSYFTAMEERAVQ